MAIVHDCKKKFSGADKKKGPKNMCFQNPIVGLTEFESVTPSPPDLYANQLRYSPILIESNITENLLFVNRIARKSFDFRNCGFMVLRWRAVAGIIFSMIVRDIAFIAIGVLMIIVGIIGCIVPGMPGTPLCWGALMLGYFVQWTKISIPALVIFGVLTVAVEVLNNFVPGIFTKKSGGSKAGSRGAMVGVMLGVFTGNIVGILLGPFLGALVGELIHDHSQLKTAFKSAWFSFLGFLTGSGLRLMVSCAIVIYYISSFFHK